MLLYKYLPNIIELSDYFKRYYVVHYLCLTMYNILLEICFHRNVSKFLIFLVGTYKTCEGCNLKKFCLIISVYYL